MEVCKDSPEAKVFAVFPLPNMVAFPGQTVSLHIFEPRYRKMVGECLEKNLPLGLALPHKTLSELKPEEATKDPLNSNLSTYEPHSTMGIGSLDVHKVSKDGRIYLNVFIEDIVRVERVLQEVPFYIAQGPTLSEPRIEASEETFWREKLSLSLKRVFRTEKALLDQLNKVLKEESPSLSEMTYLVFRWCRLDPLLMQQLLEMRNPLLRAQLLLQILNPQEAKGIESTFPRESEKTKGDLLNFPKSPNL